MTPLELRHSAHVESAPAVGIRTAECRRMPPPSIIPAVAAVAVAGPATLGSGMAAIEALEAACCTQAKERSPAMHPKKIQAAGSDLEPKEEEGEEEEGEEEEDFIDVEEDEDEEEEGVGSLARSVVQVRTLHRVPNFIRPWEEGHDAESRSSGFVVEAGVVSESEGPPRRQLLLMTTAGSVEFARKVEVCRAADDAMPYTASVVAVCLDLDVALLRVDEPGFWGPYDRGTSGIGSAARGGSRRRSRGRQASAVHDEDEADDDGSSSSSSSTALVPIQLDRGLPHLRKPVVVAGFTLGGGSLCFTRGVVSRIEVVEYSHSGRALLALQVDAPLNNGGWGAPAVCPASGRCVGMAFQKFTSQTWMERYDDVASEVYQDDGGGEDGDGGGDGGGGGEEGDGDDGGGAPGQEYDEDAENIGYLVPAQLLQLVLDDYSRHMSYQYAFTSSSPHSPPHPATATTAAAASRRGLSGTGAKRGKGSGGARAATAAASGSDSGVVTRGSAPLYLDGRPRLGLRYQRLESPALRRSLGLSRGESGVLVTGVDPTGSAAGAVQVHDVLLAVGGRQVANDGTTLLWPGQRVLFGHWPAVAQVGELLTVKVLRGRTRLELQVRLRGAGDSFLPVSLGPSRRPNFLVVGPLVFTAFSLPLWYELSWSRRHLASAASRRSVHSGLVPILGAMEWGLPAEGEGEEVVVLTEVLGCGEDGGGEETSSSSSSSSSSSPSLGGALEDEQTTAATITTTTSGSSSTVITDGGGGVGEEAAAWSRLLQGPSRLASVNGQRCRNLFLRFCFEPGGDRGVDSESNASSSGRSSGSGGSGGGPGVTRGSWLAVLDSSRVAADTRAVLKHHSLSAAMSGELRRRLFTNWPFESGAPASGTPRQRRRQGRRVGLSGRRCVDLLST
ncbi:hypothetical protein VOLCADRAFT_86747 [Volvox carteri f. nagariensis]|uniref:PDZ domain-containing protein n=1 Tax=Volvox carteri f. nagariensis TaxID=3068 RepID=D8TJH8_VOLCA|nr:uncharacterized protein VOLCADRAFT_86747 [Volvox carteri f. nagariensis]EFJ52376.1 hypothetical protein VOLCADRAFT_86747 [Volvox carteri f. nagariensis]|eukprot:XP_002946449.1 hypothetical protein VOLCADRAFT_86747 [Volvox carteri f. nagariensis]